MDICFECPHCDQQIVVDEAGAGLQVACPRCQAQLTVPQPPAGIVSASPSESEPQYRCSNSRCGAEWSEDRLLREVFKGTTRLFCPKCRHGVVKITEPLPFWSEMPGVFVYPFHGDGTLILAFTTLLLVFLELAQKIMGLAGYLASGGVLLARIIVGGWFGMLLINIIHTTSEGEEKTMESPDLSGWENLREVFMQLAGSGLAVFLPAILCQLFLPTGSIWRVLTASLWVLGTVYYPMALLAVVMFDSVSAVNPLLVLPAIVRTLRHYLLVVALVGAVLLLGTAGLALLLVLPWGWRLVAYLPLEFYSLYSLVVTARLLGLLYRANSVKLAWLD